MLTSEEDMEAHALRARGWSISAIARHLRRDRGTIRRYLAGETVPGERRPAGPDPFELVAAYVAQRFVDDPHVQATALFDEAVALGFDQSYATFTRKVRARGLRPACPACATGVTPTIEITHPAGEETQFDWVELPGAPWADGANIDVFVGALAHSGRFRGVICEQTDQPHTFDAITRVSGRLGGTTRRWRFDRMATVVEIGTDRVLPSFAAFAKHHAVGVDVCPPRRAKRKGVVEKAIDFLTQRWWRTADVTTPEQAQASLDAFCETIADARPRHDAEGRSTTVAALAATERLRALPAARWPATCEVDRIVAANATVAYRGNRYAVDPTLVGAPVLVRHHLDTHLLDIIDPESGLLTRHRRVGGTGVLVRDGEQAHALQTAVLAAFTTDPPCHRKRNRPPSAAAKAIAATITGGVTGGVAPGEAVVIDLGAYARHVPEAGR